MPENFSYGSRLLSYEIHGQGQDVVLLHGFGEDRHIWDEQVAFLKPYCRLIVPDIPGTGASSLLQPAQEEAISIEAYADVLYALLRQLQAGNCILLGHSMGGYITLAFAEKYPGMLKGFGLVHSTAFADSEEKKKVRERGIALMGEYGAHAFLKNTIPNLFAQRFREEHPEKIQQLIDAAASFSDKALQQYYRAMLLRPDRTHVLAGNTKPVLFVIGTEDVAAPMEDVLKQVSLPNISYIHILPGTGHMGMWEAPEQLNQHLLAFINA